MTDILNATGFWAIAIALIVGFFGLAAFVTMLWHERKAKELELNPVKRRLMPNKAFAEPGVCQCGDALCYHAAAGLCGVEGCPCKLYVPSDAEENVLHEAGRGTIARLAITAINTQQEYESKVKMLESSRPMHHEDTWR